MVYCEISRIICSSTFTFPYKIGNKVSFTHHFITNLSLVIHFIIVNANKYHSILRQQ